MHTPAYLELHTPGMPLAYGMLYANACTRVHPVIQGNISFKCNHICSAQVQLECGLLAPTQREPTMNANKLTSTEAHLLACLKVQGKYAETVNPYVYKLAEKGYVKVVSATNEVKGGMFINTVKVEIL